LKSLQEGEELALRIHKMNIISRKIRLILSARVDGRRAETIELKLPELNKYRTI
jgi:hypothetical protein